MSKDKSVEKKKKGYGKFILGAAVGAGLGILFAPKSGKETRADLKRKLDELVDQIKNIDVEEVKAEFDRKVEEIKEELADMDKEKAIELVMKNGAEELVELAKEKGTPALRRTAQAVLKNVVKVSNDALKKLEKAEKEDK